MISLEDLKNYGADTDEGIGRCMGMEDFYLKLVNTLPADVNFEKMETAIETGDAKSAFEASHALKGVLGNLSITPLIGPVTEICERVRGKDEMPDLSDIIPAYKEALEGLKAIQ